MHAHVFLLVDLSVYLVKVQNIHVCSLFPVLLPKICVSRLWKVRTTYTLAPYIFFIPSTVGKTIQIKSQL